MDGGRMAKYKTVTCECGNRTSRKIPNENLEDYELYVRGLWGLCNKCGKHLSHGRFWAKKVRDKQPLFDRIMSKIQQNGECLEYTGYKSHKGYGAVYVGNKYFRATRVVWEHYNNKSIPEGYVVCHKCDNPPCVNPNHLFVGTVIDNINDKINKKRHPHGETMWTAKLTDEYVREARKLYEPRKITIKMLADKYGVTWRTMASVIRREIWKHVD